jgi:hypothetical protein
MRKQFLSGLIVFVVLTSMAFVSMTQALTITEVSYPTLSSGESGTLSIRVENEQEDTLRGVKFSLDLTGLPLSTSGSSEDFINELEEDEDGKFTFILKSDIGAKPGNYKIPYTLTYSGDESPRKGTLGIRISGDTNLDYSVLTQDPIEGQKGKITLKIINLGTGDASFLRLKILPEGYTLFSEDSIYIGSINSDDFENAVLDVQFLSQDAKIIGLVSYEDSEKNKITETINIPFEVYTREKAIEIGLIERNNSLLYVGIVILLIIIWLIYRSISRRKRAQKRSQAQN